MKRYYLFLLLSVSLAVGAGCSSDPDTPLGSGFVVDSLIQSRPGQVFQDTIYNGSTDTSFVTNSFYSAYTSVPTKLILGRDDNFESWALVRFNLSAAGVDTAKTVTLAQLALTPDPGNQTITLGAVFYELLQPFENGDTMTTLGLGNPIPDPDAAGSIDRTMRGTNDRFYSLPDSLVQAWIRGIAPNNGFAIVLNDTTTSQEMTYANQANTDVTKTQLQVSFSDGSTSNYDLLANGVFAKDLTVSTDLRLSDGDTRRVWFPVDLSAIPEEVLLHDARFVVNVVPNSSSETESSVELYAPNDSVIGSSGILTGTPIVSASMGSSGAVEFAIRNIIATWLREQFDDIPDNSTNFGFVIRYFAEGSATRRADLYSSAEPDSVRPRMTFTFSTPPTFPPDSP